MSALSPALICCLLSGAAFGQADEHPQKLSGETAFRFIDGLIWVEVVVPQRAEPLHCVVDTGAGVTVLDREVARELGLRRGRTVSVQGIHGPVTARRVDGFQGRVGDVSLPGNPLTLDLSPASARCHRRIDGLIGADFFERQTAQFDFAAGTIRLGIACRPLGMEATELELKRVSDTWCVSVSVDGSQPRRVRVDTGCDAALTWWPGTPESAGRKRNRKPASPGFAAVSGQSDLANVRMGGHSESAEVILLAQPVFAGESGLLGNGILSKHRVTLDIPNRRLILEP